MSNIQGYLLYQKQLSRRIQNPVLGTLATPKTSLCSTYNKLAQAGLEQFIINSNATRMFHGRQRILDHILDVAIDVDLL